MKKNILALAFALTLASTTAFADGETGHGNRAPIDPPATTAFVDGETGHGNRNASDSSLAASRSSSSDNFLSQVLSAIYAIIA